MISDAQELAASLRYVQKWADTLEGMRRDAEERDATLFPTVSAGPISEIRRVLAEASDFLHDYEGASPSDRPLLLTGGKEKAA